MKKLFGRLFISILSVSLFVLVFVMFFITLFFIRASRQWSANSFNDFSHRLAICLAQNTEPVDISTLIETSLNCSLEDNRISGLIFRDKEGKVVYSFGKTQIGDSLSQRPDDKDVDLNEIVLDLNNKPSTEFKTVITTSPINLIQTKYLNNNLFVDLIHLSSSDSIFEKREIEVPSGVEDSFITGSIMIMENDEFSYAIDVLVFTPTTYKYSKDIFSIGGIWILAIVLIALQFSLVLSYHFSKQIENYAKGLKKALFKLSKGEENVDLPRYNVEEYQDINKAVKLLDRDLSLNRKNRKAWLRNITHDLNTPVTSMQILLDGVEDKIFPLNEETISLLKKEHLSLSKRINRVVLYASLQSPDKEIMLSICSTAEIISALKKVDLDSSRVKFVEYSKIIEADYSTIVLAISCLIENALEYGKGEVLVELSRCEIKVTNKGHLLDNVAIFEPWERGDKSRTSGGNGLGLPIVHEVMRLHEGSIKLKNIDDKVIATLKWEKHLNSLI